MHSSSPPPRCAACPFKREERLCCVPGGKHPPDCPSAAHTDLVEKSRRTYAQPDIRHFARQAARVERHSYAKLPDGGRMPCRPRILEIVAFARAMGYHRLGLLFCIGLRREAAGGQVVPLAGGVFLRLTRPNGMGEPVRQKLYYNFGHLEGCLFCFRRSL